MFGGRESGLNDDLTLLRPAQPLAGQIAVETFADFGINHARMVREGEKNVE